MPSGFAPGRGSFATRDAGLRFEMTREGSDFIQTAIHATPTGEQRTSTRVALVYGLGAADQVFHGWHGDQLVELPMAWLHPQNQWGITPYAAFSTAADFSRETTTRCLECHNTWFEHTPGTLNQYNPQSLILGVTCERCHGPGHEHVAYHQAHPEAETGHAIVHPGRLTRNRQMDVCGQCHSNTFKPRGPTFSYRPGKPLESYFRISISQHPEKDHVANQVQYLRQSKCFQKSESLTCITCHNPHRPDQAKSVRGSCAKCHQPADCGEQSRLPAAVRGLCVDCHMPRRLWMNTHFHTEEDQFVPPIWRHQHRIGIDPTARLEVLLAWYRTQSDAASQRETSALTTSLVEHWWAEAERFRREYRFLAAIGALREAVRVDPTPATRAKLAEVVAIQAQVDADLVTGVHQLDEHRYPEAAATFTRILEVKPDLGIAHGKLGTICAIAGQKQQAIEHLQAVTKYDPDNQYGYAMLGWLAYLEDKAEDAVTAYRRADEIEPFNAKINYQLGLALARLGRWQEAIDHFRLVLTIDPKHANGCQCLSQALRRQGQPAEALRYAVRAARLTSFQNAEMLLNLADSYADAGRFAEARDTGAQALEAARMNDPKLLPRIYQRLDEFRAHLQQAPN